MRCIAIENYAPYLPLIAARLTKPLEVGFDFEAPSVITG
jgi:site-specific DNA-methyltransferase (adenine-specific)